MVKGTTSTGFDFEYDPTRLDDMRFVDILAVVADDKAGFLERVKGMSQLITMLLGSELKEKLYDHIGHDMDGVENDIKFDFLTQNEGRDGKQYLWYMDSGTMAIIDEDGNISEDHDKIDELFC